MFQINIQNTKGLLMKTYLTTFLIIFSLLLSSILFAQEERRSKGEFVTPKNEFFKEIQKSADEFISKTQK